MKTIKLLAFLSIGFSGANHEEELEIEVDDNASKEEIEEVADVVVKEWADNYIDFSYKLIEDEES